MPAYHVERGAAARWPPARQWSLDGGRAGAEADRLTLPMLQALPP